MLFTYENQPLRRTIKVDGTPILPTPANVKYAHRLAVEIKDKIRHGIFSMAEYFPADGSAHAGTLADQLRAWLNAQRIEPSTKAGYQTAINFWTSALVEDKPLGARPLRLIRTSHILTALATRPELSGKTINNYVSVLREALQLAVMDRLLPENPALEVKRAKYQKPLVDPFSREEAETIVEGSRRRHPDQVANLIEFWIWSGPRTSEVWALRWPQVHLQNGAVTISEAVVAGRRKGTKTNVARTVLLNSRALGALQQQRAHTQLVGGAVFLDPRYNAPWENERAFRRSYWAPLLARLGIRYRRPYNMRHTYATAMLMAGMSPAFCARQLGHSVQVFLTTYAKWIDGAANAAEMQRLEAALGDSSLKLTRGAQDALK